eukprot:TRINITY_DN67138_c0_g1_i1.p1 TRINITY_DN67138_c0_g1~~TRINITY_DN67138_c0_g1_i1.p1  ORF type:complete len:181 (-),score=22.71 TRINITY_DN67138_c0_g1_i1:221-763(-)
MMQRPRWADLVDSSDDEMSFAKASRDTDMGVDLVLEEPVATTGKQSACRTPTIRRRTVRMPMFTKQVPSMTPTKPAVTVVVPARATKFSGTASKKQGTQFGCDSEEGWERRFQKRVAAIQIVKAMPEYQSMKQNRLRRPPSCSTPRTPDPADQAISKRRWEAEVAMWRTATREQYMKSIG